MIRTTIMIPEATKERVEDLAQREGLSFAEFIRRAIEGEVAKKSQPAGRSRDSLFEGFDRLLSEASAGSRDGSEDHDRHLYGQ